MVCLWLWSAGGYRRPPRSPEAGRRGRAEQMTGDERAVSLEEDGEGRWRVWELTGGMSFFITMTQGFFIILTQPPETIS